MKDKIVLYFDKEEGQDHVVLTAGRHKKKGFEMVNEIYDKEARDIYKQLTGRKLK